MSTQAIKDMFREYSTMSQETIQQKFNAMGMNMDVSLLVKFINIMKDASDEDINKLKEQYKNGKIKMGSFKK
jgi:tryptophanyl-tRNA synthetase